jgi:copper(I)-binding protein
MLSHCGKRTSGGKTVVFKAISRRSILGLFFAGLFLVGVRAADDAAIVARDGWLRQPPASLMEAAIYVVIENHTDQRRSIVSGTADIAEKVELHQMTMNHMLMQMTPVPRVDLPAKGKATFEPNALHIMLFGLKKRPMVGETVTVNLTLDDGTVVPVTATVRKK